MTNVVKKCSPCILLILLLTSACDSGGPVDDDDVQQDPGTFSAAVEGTQSAEISGEARYGINEEGDLRIALLDAFGAAREVIVFAHSGSELSGGEVFRISEAPDGGISSGDESFFGFYIDGAEEGIRGSDSGRIGVVDREEGLLEAQFHFTAAFSGGSDYVSVVGAFAAEETDDIDSFIASGRETQ